MKIFAGLLILAVSLQPLLVLTEAAAAAAAAAAASSSNGGASVATATAVAVSDSTSTARIPCKCNRIYQPVCGSDGITYSNECILRCVSANNVNNGRPPICIKKQGVCPQTPCKCTAVNNPLCATDGQTYGNDCLLCCENKRREIIGLPPIKIKHRGVCKYPICTCPDLVIPVCGTDNKTYRNVCVLQCVSRHNQANGKPCIGVLNNGACAKESCMCPANLDPICASDGKTYSNLCMLQCQNRRRNQLGLCALSVQYKGKCVDCHCPTIYDPVCASNDVTFANICTLGCENKKRKEKKLPPLKIKNYGVCPCICKLIWAPVCGSDKKTYSNKCLLNCENKRRSDLGIPLIWVKKNGRCYCDCDYCPTYYGPVCGSDGRTYWNKCFFACHRDCNSNLFMTKQGPC